MIEPCGNSAVIELKIKILIKQMMYFLRMFESHKTFHTLLLSSEMGHKPLLTFMTLVRFISIQIETKLANVHFSISQNTLKKVPTLISNRKYSRQFMCLHVLSWNCQHITTLISISIETGRHTKYTHTHRIKL